MNVRSVCYLGLVYNLTRVVYYLVITYYCVTIYCFMVIKLCINRRTLILCLWV